MKILCVGSNYSHHVTEMGGTAPRQPVWFWKPESAIVRDTQPVRIPPGIGEVHHEVELAIQIGKEAHGIHPDAALSCVEAFTVAVDVTARELQKQAKAEGRPWARAKGFDTFLPLGPWNTFAGQDLQDLRLRLTIDGELRQDGHTGDMTWRVAELIAAASKWTTLVPGDILLTGTPEGVGPIEAGQEMTAEIPGWQRVTNPIRSA